MPIEIAKGGVVLSGENSNEVIRAVVQELASLKAAGVTDLTDNSSGTSGGATLAAIGTVAAFTVTGTDIAPKAGFDTNLALVKNALKTINTKLEATATAIGVTLGVTYSGAGTDGSGTIAAISAALTEVDGTGSNGLAYAGTNALILTYANAIATLCKGVNKCRTAVGLTPITDNSGGTFQSTVAALAGSSGSGVDGTSLSGVLGTDAEGVLTDLKNAVATLAAGLNAVTGASQNVRVVAV